MAGHRIPSGPAFRCGQCRLASTSASLPEVVTEIQKLKAQLPHEVLDVMDRHEAAGDYAHPEYQAAVMELYKRYLCRLEEWPDCLMRSVANIDGNQVYLTMNGPNEFTTIGNLKDWERRDRLHEISVPTLITVGGHDELPLACAQTLPNGIRGSELAVFDQSSHVAMLEETDAYIGRLADFLAGVEKATAQVDA